MRKELPYGKKRTTGRVKRELPVGENKHYQYTQEEIAEDNQHKSRTCGASIDSLVSSVRTRNRTKLAEKGKKADSKLTHTSFTALWQSSVLEHYSRSPVVNVNRRDFAALRSNLNVTRLPVPLSEFVQWSVANWEELRSGPLVWCKNMSEIPDPSFYCFMLQHFAKHYGEVTQKAERQSKVRIRELSEARRLERENERLQLELEAERRNRERAEKRPTTTEGKPRKRFDYSRYVKTPGFAGKLPEYS